MRPRTEHGSTIPLVIGLMVVVVLVIAVAVDVGAALLRRSALQTLADGAALAAADAGASGTELYATGVTGSPLQITVPDAVAAARTSLDDAGLTSSWPGATEATSVSGDRRSVTVTVRTPLRLPFGFPGVVRTRTVSASATAGVVPRP